MSLLSPIISGLLSSVLGPLTRPQPHSCSRIIIKASAFIFLLSGYILGCIALYHYLTPCLGEVFSLLAIGIVFLGTSLFLFILGWSLRPKHNTFSTSVSPLIEKTLKQVPTAKDVGKALQDIPPTLPIVALVVATGIAAYFISKKRDIF